MSKTRRAAFQISQTSHKIAAHRQLAKMYPQNAAIHKGIIASLSEALRSLFKNRKSKGTY